jgi:hypothetical protein
MGRAESSYPCSLTGAAGEEAAPEGGNASAPTAECDALCVDWTPAQQEAAEADLAAAFPLLPLQAANAQLLRQRRCRACRVVSAAMSEMYRQAGAKRR